MQDAVIQTPSNLNLGGWPHKNHMLILITHFLQCWRAPETDSSIPQCMPDSARLSLRLAECEGLDTRCDVMILNERFHLHLRCSPLNHQERFRY